MKGKGSAQIFQSFFSVQVCLWRGRASPAQGIAEGPTTELGQQLGQFRRLVEAAFALASRMEGNGYQGPRLAVADPRILKARAEIMRQQRRQVQGPLVLQLVNQVSEQAMRMKGATGEIEGQRPAGAVAARAVWIEEPVEFLAAHGAKGGLQRVEPALAGFAKLRLVQPVQRFLTARTEPGKYQVQNAVRQGFEGGANHGEALGRGSRASHPPTIKPVSATITTAANPLFKSLPIQGSVASRPMTRVVRPP